MRACIYLVTNLINGKIYIGKTNNLKKRWAKHASAARRKNDKDYSYLHRAINKYGIDNFKIENIEWFDNENEAYWFETWWIEFLRSDNRNIGYNLNKGGKGGVSPNAELRQKLVDIQNQPHMKKANSERRKEWNKENKEFLSSLMKKRHKANPGFLAKINKGNQYTKGHKLSDEHKRKISEFNKGKIISQETRKKMSEAQTGSKHSQAKLTEKDIIYIRQKYIPLKYSCAKLAREYNVSNETIRKIVKRISWSHVL